MAFSRMVGVSMQAREVLEAQGISAEVINLRSIRPLDIETINKSIQKTKRLVVVEDGYSFSGVCAEVIA